MIPNVPISDSGTATLGITVADRLRRNRKITITTSAMVSIRVNSTSRTEARMVVVRSEMIETFTAEGSDARSCGSRRLVRSTTLMMFVPGCLWMFRITAGVVFTQAACLTFSALSTTVATSDRRTGAPLRYATMMGA